MFSTAGVERAAINPDGTGSGLLNGGSLPDVVAHRPTGVAATDDAMLAEALSDTPEGGWLYLPGHTDRVTAYALINEFAPAKHMRITGAGCFPNWESVATGNADTPIHTPYLRGTILMQTTAAKSGVKVTAASKKIDMSGFGVLFHPTIMFSNTGNGFEFSPPSDAHGDGTGYDVCLWDAILRDLVVFGHDGNHCGFFETNPLLGQRGPYLRSFGGGIYYMASNSNRFNMGNLAFGEIYGSVFVAGTAHMYEFSTLNSEKLNMVRAFARMQGNFDNLNAVFGTAIPLNTQKRLYVHQAAGASWVDADFAGLDLEANDGVSHLITVDAASQPTTTLHFEGGYAGGGQSYMTEREYNGFAASGRIPTVSAGAALGSGGSPGVVIPGAPNSDDMVGAVQVTAGSTPGSANTNAFTLNFASLRIQPRWVQLIPGPDGWAATLQPYVSARTSTGFTVRFAQALPASQAFVIAYRVLV